MLYGIKDAANLTVTSNTTNKPVLYADYCNSTNIEFSSSQVNAMKKGVKAISWDSNREGTFTTEMQVFDLKWIALLMGTSLKAGSFTINKREVVKVTSGSATLTETPKAGSLIVFKCDPTGMDQGDEQTVGAPASTANTYSISAKVVTLNTTTTFATDGYIVAYYLIDSDASKTSFTVTATDFPAGYSICGDSSIRDESNVDHMIQFNMGNVKPQSNVSLSMNSDDCTTLSVTWDILADANGNMLTWKNL